jgi:hypothetical protein
MKVDVSEAEETETNSGIGLSGFGLLISLTFLAKGYWQERRKQTKDAK